jgi:LmbE family N-acetylglucosaminyl deacetylase
VKNVLVIAPHNDDEVLGVGGTIRKHALAGDRVTVCELTSGPRWKILQAEAREAHAVLGVAVSRFLDLPVCKLRNLEQPEINAKLSAVVAEAAPEIAYLPFIGDMHVDHREAVESAMTALRPLHCPTVKAIFMYETLSETGWNLPSADRAFIPNAWSDISETFADKLEAMRCYRSQVCEFPHPRSPEAIEALARFRGSTVGLRYAESLMAVRLVL